MSFINYFLIVLLTLSLSSSGCLAGILSKHSFVSHTDGQEDNFALLTSDSSKTSRSLLLVYLHGMGSNYLEPFLLPQKEPIAYAIERNVPNLVFLSCGFGKEASWGNDPALVDITENIRQVMQEYPIDRIVLMGSSMGGTIALTYACLAPDDIKRKIIGVVSSEATGDLRELFALTENEAIRPAMIKAFNGTPEQVPQAYAQKSFLYNLRLLPQSLRIAIISAKDDRIVPAKLQKDIVAALRSAYMPVKLIELAAGHSIAPIAKYLESLDFVLNQGKQELDKQPSDKQAGSSPFATIPGWD